MRVGISALLALSLESCHARDVLESACEENNKDAPHIVGK
jgi:hypothetical protein